MCTSVARYTHTGKFLEAQRITGQPFFFFAVRSITKTLRHEAICNLQWKRRGARFYKRSAFSLILVLSG